MGCPATVVLEDNLVFSVCCHDPDSGVLTDADAVPKYRIYDDAGTQVWPLLSAEGSMDKIDDDNTTGFYAESVECSADNGFESGKIYSIYIEATVDGDTGGISYEFKVVPATVTPDPADGIPYDTVMSALMAVMFGKTSIDPTNRIVEFLDRAGTTVVVRNTYSTIDGERLTSVIVS